MHELQPSRVAGLLESRAIERSAGLLFEVGVQIEPADRTDDAEYLSKGSEQPWVAYTSDHAWNPGVSLSTIKPSKSNISAATCLVEPKRLLYLCVGHRPHAFAIEPPFVHVLRGLDDAHTRGLEQCLDAGVCVGSWNTRLECTE